MHHAVHVVWHFLPLRRLHRWSQPRILSYFLSGELGSHNDDTASTPSPSLVRASDTKYSIVSQTVTLHHYHFNHICMYLPRAEVEYFFFFLLLPTRLIFLNGLMILCRRMTWGLCYLETFKAELSLVILCLARQEALLTLKLVLLNSRPCPPVMWVSINKRCCWCCGRSLLAFIHISPLWPCKSNHPEDGNIFISLAPVPPS